MKLLTQATGKEVGRIGGNRKGGTTPARASQRAFCAQIALCAVRSLHAELTLYPKPGLVSPVDSGSHSDMDAGLFMRSLFSLRHYFFYMASEGASDAPFARLKELGMLAEGKMLSATAGVNTHRGSIFSLGLLCAASGYCFSYAQPLSESALRASLLSRWGDALATHASVKNQSTHGLRVAQLYSIGGAREEACQGFPSIFEIALPQLRASIARGSTPKQAQIDVLFSLMANINDTNIYHRGGDVGASVVQQAARHFLASGGTANPQWRELALEYHRLFVSKRLSPGGAADLLAASWFVYQSTTGRKTQRSASDA